MHLSWHCAPPSISSSTALTLLRFFSPLPVSVVVLSFVNDALTPRIHLCVKCVSYQEIWVKIRTKSCLLSAARARWRNMVHGDQRNHSTLWGTWPELMVLPPRRWLKSKSMWSMCAMYVFALDMRFQSVIQMGPYVRS